MAFRLLLRPRPFALGVGLSTVALSQSYALRSRSLYVQCDTTSNSNWGASRDSKAPSLKGQGLNPSRVRQMSTGSILGLVAGIAVGTFSKTIAFFIGIGVIGVQWAASYGVNLIPYNKIQRYIKGVNLRSLMQENAAFKVAFGSTFALAAFVDL
ncbi:MAG: hypothetical protein M1814_004402 [Vezdaea aestivalis]|nr:MAG: hypothetical protein M1814_004402 [Vezdaea aestivalis]